MRGPYHRRRPAAPHVLVVLLASTILATVAWSTGYVHGFQARPPLVCSPPLYQVSR